MSENQESANLPRISWSNLTSIGRIVAIVAAIMTAATVMQNQLTDHERRLASTDNKFERRDAADHVRDSLLTVINYERQHGLFPTRPTDRQGVTTKRGKAKEGGQSSPLEASMGMSGNGKWSKVPVLQSLRSMLDSAMSGVDRNHE